MKSVLNVAAAAEAGLISIMQQGQGRSVSTGGRLRGVTTSLAYDLPSEHVVPPEGAIFRDYQLGVVPPCPVSLLHALRERCPIADDGRSVGETHRLLFLPAAIDGVSTTIQSLRQFAADSSSLGEMVFFNQKWYDHESFSRVRLSESRWILMYGEPAPFTLGLNDHEQEEVVKSFPRYRTASVLEVVGAIVMQFLSHGERLFAHTMVRCADSSSAGARVTVGLFDERGFGFSDSFDDFRLPFLGRAIVREI